MNEEFISFACNVCDNDNGELGENGSIESEVAFVNKLVVNIETIVSTIINEDILLTIFFIFKFLYSNKYKNRQCKQCQKHKINYTCTTI